MFWDSPKLEGATAKKGGNQFRSPAIAPNMGDVEPRERKHEKSADKARPNANDRSGSGLHDANIESRILAVTVEHDRTRITMSKGKWLGVQVGMDGYIRGPGGMLSELQVDAVEDARCHAFVDVTPDELRTHRLVVLNPTSKPRAPITRDVDTRVIGVSVEGGRTRITIARGATHGVTAGMRGQLVSTDGRAGDDFTIAGTTALQSVAFVASNVDDVIQHKNVVLHSSTSGHAAPVQRRANGQAVVADIQSTAQEGVASATSRLPHFDTIQRAFGQHDISRIQANVGGTAATAAGSLGAHAYATGERVAFASAPCLHTAAHEAAHAIQQRNGVVSFQGVGAVDDEHERHADAVADAVVAGRSAEPLLDALTPGAGTTAIQRKERRGNDSGVVADDLVKSDKLTKVPGRAKQIDVPDDGRVGDRSIDGEAVCHGRGRETEGCFLSDRGRDRLVGQLFTRVAAASSRFNDAIESVKAHELAKRPEDLHWAWAMLLDVAANFVIGAAIKSLTKIRLGKIKDYGNDEITSILAGRYEDAVSADRRAALFRGVSDEVIRQQVSGVGGLVKSNARAGMKAAFEGETREKTETVNYLTQLQTASDLAYQNLASNVASSSTDVELVVIWEGMSVEYHGVEMYKRAIIEKLERWRASGVHDIGRSRRVIESGVKRDVTGWENTDKRVVWVQHPDGQKSLWYQDHASRFVNPDARYGMSGQGTARLTGLVPREFWEEAVVGSERQWGEPTRILIDSPQTRAALGVSPENPAAKPTGYNPNHIMKIFGGE